MRPPVFTLRPLCDRPCNRPCYRYVTDCYRPVCVHPHTPCAVTARALGLGRPSLAATLRKGQNREALKRDKPSRERLETSPHAQYRNNLPFSRFVTGIMPCRFRRSSSLCALGHAEHSALRLLAFEAPAATDFADIVQTRMCGPVERRAFISVSATRPYDCKSHERVFARVSNHVFYCDEAVDRARPGETLDAWRNPSIEIIEKRPAPTRGTPENSRSTLSRHLIPISRRRSQTLLPFRHKDRLSKIGGGFLENVDQSWIGPRRASRTRPCVFQARDCADGAPSQKNPPASPAGDPA